jgi:hypothetical protein
MSNRHSRGRRGCTGGRVAASRRRHGGLPGALALWRSATPAKGGKKGDDDGDVTMT